jgi:predicted DNA binding CopG/RHH family protein/opacity protein-like surface antigen
LRKNQSLTLIFALFILGTLLVHALFTVKASQSVSSNIKVEVEHAIQVQYGGLTIINDTVKLSTYNGEENIRNFSIGFPYSYKSNLFYCFAYNTSNPNQRFNVTLDTGLGTVGYYGVTVTFPQNIQLTSDKTFNFTISFIFSNLISTSTTEKVTVEDNPENETKKETVTMFKVNFPAYPSLTFNANRCDVKAILPKNASYEASSISFNEPMLRNKQQIVNYTRDFLERFSYEFAWLNFTISETALDKYHIPIVEVEEMQREIRLDEWKQIFVTDSFTIVNRGIKFPNPIFMRLPQGVFKDSVSASDVAGNKFTTSLEEANTTTYRITLAVAPKQNETLKMKVAYKLPWDKYVSQQGWDNIKLDLISLSDPYWAPRKLIVKFILPEGARLINLNSLAAETKIEKNVFTETVSLVYYNATLFRDQSVRLTFSYLPFWSSFRPTLWVGVAVALIGVVVYLWRMRKPAVAVAPVLRIPIRPEFLKEFVDAYERKTKTLQELESLEQQVKKGRVPRRQYKVKKQMLEGRLSSISKDLSNLRQKIQAAGLRYADIMRQLEVAETEIEGANREIARIEARYRGGELSKEAYRRLREEYERRRDNAKVTIDGVLLRLKEEIP